MVAGVGFVADGAGVLRSSRAAFGEGLARGGLSDVLCGVPASVQDAPAHDEQQQNADGNDGPGRRTDGAEKVADHRISPLALAVRAARSGSWIAGFADLGLPRFTPREQAAPLS